MIKTDFPRVRLIANQVNRGFGAANNQGLDAMTRQLALLLNSDAYATPGAIARLLDVMVDPAVVACGGKLVNDDDAQATQNSCANQLTLWAVLCEQTLLEKLLPTSRLFSPYWETTRILARGSTALASVEQVMGACLLMRPVERFDERFFLYCEDTELCYRLRRHGEIRYVPEAVFGHKLGASSEQTRWVSVARYNRGKELYFQIHHGKLSSATCWYLNRSGAFLRALVWTFLTILTLFAKPRFRRSAALFWRVFFAPLSGPPRPD